MMAKYQGLRYTMEGAGREERESLSDVLNGFILALFLIYALLAIPFRSFSQPLIVMAAIPFGLVGALAGHFIMGLGTSLLSLFGMVGLTGVVVNDSLVLIDATNRLRDAGMTSGEAIREAGPMRFRAIILTSADHLRRPGPHHLRAQPAGAVPHPHGGEPGLRGALRHGHHPVADNPAATWCWTTSTT